MAKSDSLTRPYCKHWFSNTTLRENSRRHVFLNANPVARSIPVGRRTQSLKPLIQMAIRHKSADYNSLAKLQLPLNKYMKKQCHWDESILHGKSSHFRRRQWRGQQALTRDRHGRARTSMSTAPPVDSACVSAILHVTGTGKKRPRVL